LPKFTFLEAPIGEARRRDLNKRKRDYIVSNEKIERTGSRPILAR